MAKQTKSGPEYSQGENGDWYWHVRAPNGNIVGGSAEGYRRVSGAKKGFEALRSAILAMDAPAPVKPARKPRTVKAPLAHAKETLTQTASEFLAGPEPQQ